MRPRKFPARASALIVLCALLWAGQDGLFAALKEISGRVVAIHDGDTITVLTPEKKQIRVRLAEIDAPEAGQPYGSKAREMLASLCFQKEIIATYRSPDRYGRPVARVTAGEADINAEMLRQGGAWVYRKFLTDQRLLAIEEEAKAAKRGLWSLPERERIPPWEWRSERARR